MARRITKSRSEPGPRRENGEPDMNRTVAVKRVLASQIEQAMTENRLTKAEMARRMDTSRSQLNRLLDPNSDSVTLETLTRAARAVGRQVRLELIEGR
jgi:antitoxin HicB